MPCSWRQPWPRSAAPHLVWTGLRDGKGALVVALGVLALGLYGVVAALQPENEFGRVLAAYGGAFIVGERQPEAPFHEGPTNEAIPAAIDHLKAHWEAINESWRS